MYQPEFYFVGMGAGDSFEVATGKALTELTRQVEVRIEAESKGVINSYEFEDREVIESEYESVTKAVSKASLKGAQVVEKAEVNGQKYVLMVIDKDNYISGLHVELDRMRVEIQKQYNDADELLNDGKVLQSFQALIETSDAAAQFHAKATLYTSLSGKSYLTEDIISGPAILSEIRKLIGKVMLEKITGDRQATQNGSLLPEPLVVQAVIKRTGAEIPVKNLRLALKSDDKKVIEKSYTDDEGIARFWIRAFGDVKGKVYIEVDLQRIPAILKRDFRGVQVNFRYDVIPIPPMRFTVQVRDQTGKRVSHVEDKVAVSIQDAGHHVSDDAPFLISGTLIEGETQQIDGFDGVQYLVDSELTLFIQEKSSGEKIGTIQVTGKGMDKNSEETALNNSYKRMKVPKKEFIRTLSDASEKLKPIQLRLSREALAKGKRLYSSGDYENALTNLARVTAGEAELSEATQTIETIKTKLLEKQQEKAVENVETKN